MNDLAIRVVKYVSDDIDVRLGMFELASFRNNYIVGPVNAPVNSVAPFRLVLALGSTNKGFLLHQLLDVNAEFSVAVDVKQIARRRFLVNHVNSGNLKVVLALCDCWNPCYFVSKGLSSLLQFILLATGLPH